MKPLLVAWGIFNFNDIVHASKVYPGKYRSRDSSAECLVVAVEEVSVLQLPPRFSRSCISLLLLIFYLHYCDYHSIVAPPDHRVDAVDERVEIALDNHSFLISAPAHSVYFSHKSLQLLWVLSAPPTSCNRRGKPFLIPHVPGEACSSAWAVDVTDPHRCYLCVHTLLPLS